MWPIIEGFAPVVTTEAVRTVLTAVPVTLAAAWIFAGARLLERKAIWARHSEDIRRTAQALESAVEIDGPGYRVRGRDRTVRWQGGLWGERRIEDPPATPPAPRPHAPPTPADPETQPSGQR